MKIIHLSDLHIGKKVCDYSMIDEQKYILDQIIEGVKTEKPDAVLISGDVYDKTTPPLEAVLLLDDFLNRLEIDRLKVMLISGNHDSAERLSFGAKRMRKSGLYIKSVFDGDLSPVTLSDKYGEVNFYCVPFIRMADVNNTYRTNIRDYSEAFKYVVDKMNLDTSKRNVILSHQYVSGALFSESESAVGGIDDISKDIYSVFDYCALGHIHKSQNIGSERIRYCGTPLKYNVSEVGQTKSYTVVELYDKKAGEDLCEINVREVVLEPLHEMVKIEGYFDELMDMKADDEGIVTDNFVYAVLRDDHYVKDAAMLLRRRFPNLLNVSYEQKRRMTELNIDLTVESTEKQTPEQIFIDFYKKMHDDAELDELSRDILAKAIKEVYGEDAL